MAPDSGVDFGSHLIGIEVASDRPVQLLLTSRCIILKIAPGNRKTGTCCSMASESDPIYVALFPALDTLYDLQGRRVCSPNLNKHHERARQLSRTAQQVSEQCVSFSKNAPRSHSGNITRRLKYLIIGDCSGNVQIQSHGMLLSCRSRENTWTPFARGLSPAVSFLCHKLSKKY